METKAILSESIKFRIIGFLNEIPVEKYSTDWKAIQVAIAMIMAPNSYKKGVHVYIPTHEGGREEGAFDSDEISIKIWPNKIQMRHTCQEWTSWSGYTKNICHRYIFPSERYDKSHLDQFFSELGPISYSNFVDDNSDACGTCMRFSRFKIETNVK